jgi:hypothetical protein
MRATVSQGRVFVPVTGQCQPRNKNSWQRVMIGVFKIEFVFNCDMARATSYDK